MGNKIYLYNRRKANPSGATFIELLLYIAIFLVLTPILLSVSISSMRTSKQHSIEKQVNTDSQFIVERTYDLITQARRVNMSNSVFDDAIGKIELIMQDDSVVIIELNPDINKIEITEGAVKTSLSSENAKIETLYFERIPDHLNDPDIVLGVNIRLQISGVEEYDVLQNYVVSANLERGDFDKDDCPDFIDAFPRHAECCGDSDEDGVCDELDNCILAYNPFQEDFDEDGIGDECDSSIFFEGGEGEGEGEGQGGGLGAFNCGPDDQLLALINQVPPMQSSTLKSIFLASSPLSPTVLFALIDAHPLLENGHFRQVFVANTILPEGVLDAVAEMEDLPVFHKVIIIGADLAAEYMPWLGVDRRNYAEYQVTLYSDAEEPETWLNRIKFHSADTPLCSEQQTEKTDIFMVDVENGSDTVEVTTETSAGTAFNVITVDENYVQDDLGFIIELNQKSGNTYAIMVSSAYCEDELLSVEFNFGNGANITNPTVEYLASRYICYCEGGCAVDCGDIGTGIITTNVYTDKCYEWDGGFPEWCSYWYTFEDNNTENPAYLGGTQEGEETVYWEKTFQSILTLIQLQNVESITVGGEVAYQSMTQFFCDTLESSCPINGSLVGPQDIELYDWGTNTWEVIGPMNLDGTTSDQQKYEVIYDGEDVLKFIDGPGGNKIRSRMKFKWNGEPPEESESAPCFMCIDYFTVHLKW